MLVAMKLQVKFRKGAQGGTNPLHAHVGKTVIVTTKTGTFAAVAKQVLDGGMLVEPLIPNFAGLLVKSGVDLLVEGNASVEEFGGTLADGLVRSWHDQTAVRSEDCKAARVLRDGTAATAEIVDYRGVTFEGNGSTFKDTTARDRENDYVMPGAFDKSLASFRRNPVMLIDHERSVLKLAGHYSKVGVTSTGLALTGNVTDAPTEFGRHVRYAIMENSLRTLSMGGYFFYLPDFHGIQEVDLYEVSLVVVPANPDATFVVRSVDAEGAKHALARHTGRHGGEFRAKN